MLDSIENILAPVMVEVTLVLVFAGIGWLNRKLPEKNRLQIEEKHRLALHQAATTGASLIFDMIQTNPHVAITDGLIKEGLDRAEAHIRGSVPDALAALMPSRAQIEGIVRAKLQEQLSLRGLTSIDALTQQLQSAGLPAQMPPMRPAP